MEERKEYVLRKEFNDVFMECYEEAKQDVYEALGMVGARFRRKGHEFLIDPRAKQVYVDGVLVARYGGDKIELMPVELEKKDETTIYDYFAKHKITMIPKSTKKLADEEDVPLRLYLPSIE